MKVICTTSNNYLHLIPVFCYLFNKNWSKDQSVEIVGYDQPNCELPANFTFHSMGEQGPINEWSTDLRKYFESIPDSHFVWLMEDTLLKSVDIPKVEMTYFYFDDSSIKLKIGRADLTGDIQKRAHIIVDHLVVAQSNTRYRLSTQPSIWSKNFLLKYLKDGLTPWDFETQDPKNDGWRIMGLEPPLVSHNEGVRRFDPHKLDLNGFSEEDVKHINSLLV